jgi:uncharacterized delta-60 repeat protein
MKKVMKKIITLSLFALLLISNNSGSQVTEEWVKRYNGPENSADDGNSLAIDGFGNVYVTGLSMGSGTSYDYATLKYENSGYLQWYARYNGYGNDNDQARSIAVDGSGNVYVTGLSTGIGTYNDYATVKYNSIGVQQWVKSYNGPGKSVDQANSIAVDGSGNVYVTGFSAGSGTSNDYATIKYNSSGTELWVSRYDGPAHSNDQAKSLVIDASGNVYVTGWSFATGTNFDYATIKYNSSGVEQWVQRYNGPGYYYDFAAAIAVDASGNVYVTGGSYGPESDFDYATIKYNSSGFQQWVQRYIGPASGDDKATSLKIDASGNVYVTGWSESSLSSLDYVSIKYKPTGVQLWEARYNGIGNSEDMANSIAIDVSGNVYVTGSSYGTGTYRDYATLKYNASGVQQWEARYDGTGNNDDEARSIAVDGSGNVYVTGYSNGWGTGRDYATIKYSQPTPKLEKSISSSLPDEYLLDQNYPNPFNPSTTIKFSLPVEDNVVIIVSDISGKQVAELLDQNMEAGNHEITFNGSNLSSGVYFYRIITSRFTDVKKMILVK